MAAHRLIDPNITRLALCKVGANRQRVFLLKEDGESDKPVAAFARLVKAADDWSVAYVPVAVPGAEEGQGMFPTGDGDTDVWDEDQIVKAAHSFMKNGREVVAQHFDNVPVGGVELVESTVALADLDVNGTQIAKGTWYVGLEFSPELRPLVASGEIDAVSVEGFATRVAKDAALVPNKPGVTNWVERTGGLPKKIADLAGDLITEKGMTTSHAIATAVAGAKRFCAMGKGDWCAAVAQWEAKKAAAHALGKSDEEFAVSLVEGDTLGDVDDEDRTLLQRMAKSLGIATQADACGCGCGEVFEVDESMDDSPDAIAKAKLSASGRKQLPRSAFAIPEKAPGPGSYPIHDRGHAANALTRAKGKPVEQRVRRAVCKRHPGLPACKQMAKEGALPEDSGSLGDVELGERVESLETKLSDLEKKLIGTDEEPGAIAKVAASVEKLAKESDPKNPPPDPDNPGNGSEEPPANGDKAEGTSAQRVAKSREDLDKQIEQVAEEFAGKIEPLAKRLGELEAGETSQQETNDKGEPVAKSGPATAGILFD